MRQRKFWGWGYEDEDLDVAAREGLRVFLADRFGVDPMPVTPPPALAEVELPKPRLRPPSRLAEICSQDKRERASHAHGMSYRDVVRAYRRDFSNPPDWVALPRTEEDIERLLDWCAGAGIAAIPFGGGTSVVGGVEPPPDRPTVSLDLRHFGRVLEVDRASRAALIEGGASGPALEEQLKPHGLTLRHFPQSFEFATLGGMIATRSGGHFATLYTHIDDFVEALRVVTPAGVVETRRLPGSGAGPQPERLFLGSEGTLGIITRAWMRLQDRPRFRSRLAAHFSRFEDALDACRTISQAGLYPANCRLLDPNEALYNGAGDGTQTILLVAFESADHPVDAWATRATEICGDHHGEVPPGHEGAGETWRDAFIKMPYRRDALAGMGVLSETFETAVTWDRFESFNQEVLAATSAAMADAGAGRGWISLRFTHVYPDGPAPYYSVMGPARRGQELEQWQAIKTAAADAISKGGGTITHHHAVGRDHRPWYDRERPPLFAQALRAAKQKLDPSGILNPGVLLDP